jgi:Ca-activated chloride channel family protein
MEIAMRCRSALLTLLVAPLLAGAAAAQGLVIPNEPELPPLALRKHKVRVEVSQQGATTIVEQTFVNNTERRLEAQYVFPIPKGAAMSRFTMLVGGKETKGEIVEKTQARSIYNSMVNRLQEPGLLEYVGSEVFRANIFPIEPHAEQVITIQFEQVLPSENGLIRYVYPVRNGARRGPTVHGEFSIQITLKDATPIQNIYSPSHAVDIVRASEREARVSYSEKYATLEKDFQVYYGTGDKEIGLNLATFRPDPAQPGYFMMLVSPKSKLQAQKLVARDLVFVIDTSGSMAGEKIKQARNALKFCIAQLNDGDRFNIVQFSTDVTAWKKDLVSAAENRAAATAWAETLLAQGGTAINDALETALSFTKDRNRPYYVIFMTDGLPTIGNTKPQAILQSCAKGRTGTDQVRIFTWGVGYDVDTHLLDEIAENSGGVSEYVHPEEDIAAKVAAFYGKASHPVLTGLELKIAGDKVQLVNMHPHVPSDLYAGSQLVVIGRYVGEGDVAMKLTGRVNDKSESFDYETRFPASEKQNAFLETLWARRQIGHLLMSIRLHGETKELIDDVVRLSVEYGIQTPYTSFLIGGDKPQAKAPGAGAGGEVAKGRGAFNMNREERDKLDDMARRMNPAPPPAAQPNAQAPADPAADFEAKKEEQLSKSLEEGFKQKDGKAAVETAGYLKSLRGAERSEPGRVASSKKVSGRRFFEYRGIWVDEKFEASHGVTNIKFGSPAYFKLAEKYPELLPILQLGTGVLCVTAPGKAVLVGSEGETELTDARIEALFK